MKRRAIGCLFFSFTLILGVFVGEPSQPKELEVRSERYECNLGLTNTGTNFDPEFRNLRSTDDFYTYRKPKGRLIHFFEDGIFRESEVVARHGEPWMVIDYQNGSFVLQRAKAEISKLKSVSWPGDEPDAKLSFDSIANPILALNFWAPTKPGHVKSLFWNGPQGEEMAEGFEGELTLEGARTLIRTSTGLTRENERVAVLVLESNGVKQIIEQIPYFAPPERNIIGNLLWAGDLDADGKLDLYIDEFNEKGYIHTKLFLSSIAESGELVGFFGSFGAAGC